MPNIVDGYGFLADAPTERAVALQAEELARVRAEQARWLQVLQRSGVDVPGLRAELLRRPAPERRARLAVLALLMGAAWAGVVLFVVGMWRLLGWAW